MCRTYAGSYAAEGSDFCYRVALPRTKMSDPSSRADQESASPTTFTEDPALRQARLSQALLQDLTQTASGSDTSPSSAHTLDSDFREHLAAFIESTTEAINALKRRVAQLEFVHR